MAKTEWSVSVRFRPAFRAEATLALWKAWSGDVEGAVAMIEGPALQEQLVALRAKSPAATEADVVKAIAVHRRSLAPGQCPELRRLAASLEGLKLSILPSSRLMLDAHTYELVARTRSGEVRTEIQGPGEGAVVAWLEKAERLAYESCNAPRR